MAFDAVERLFMVQSLQIFAYGNIFLQHVVILPGGRVHRFNLTRGTDQGCSD